MTGTARQFQRRQVRRDNRLDRRTVRAFAAWLDANIGSDRDWVAGLQAMPAGRRRKLMIDWILDAEKFKTKMLAARGNR